MMLSETKLSFTNLRMVLVVLLLITAGLVAIFSASYHAESEVLKSNFTKQMIWGIIGTILLLVTIAIPFRVFWAIAYWIYGITVLLLLLTLFSAKVADVHRWLTIGAIQFQPSEFTKIGIVLALARYLGGERKDSIKFKDLLITVGFVVIPFFIVLRQPDLGTALVFLSLILPVTYWAGLPSYFLFVMVAPILSLISAFNFYSFFIAMILIAVTLLFFHKKTKFVIFNILVNLSVGILTPILWNKFHPYQKNRILTFLGLELDAQGAGYQLIQSKVTIGSGGFLGKGFLNGTQTQLRFLPAQHTDFAFSVIGEEFGFIGVVFVLGLFYYILMRGIHIAAVSRNKFAGLLAIGAVTIIGFHVIVNVGMTVGVMPVTGIPLPFISYGGSSLIANMILIGFVMNASIRRFKY